MTAGRPTVMTTEIIERLRHAFAIGATDEEACSYANIGTTTLYDYQKLNPEFAEEKESLKKKPILKAKNNVIQAMEVNKTPVISKLLGVLKDDKGNPILTEKPDDLKNRIETSKWYLERKAKDEFSTRVESTGKNGKPLFDSEDEEAKLKRIVYESSKNFVEVNRKKYDADNNTASQNKK